jgi:hypothetical protein
MIEISVARFFAILFLVAFTAYYAGRIFQRNYARNRGIQQSSLLHVGFTYTKVDGSMVIEPGLDLREYGARSRKVYLILEDYWWTQQ